MLQLVPSLIAILGLGLACLAGSWPTAVFCAGVLAFCLVVLLGLELTRGR